MYWYTYVYIFFKRTISVMLSEEGYHSQHVGRSIGLLLFWYFLILPFAFCQEKKKNEIKGKPVFALRVLEEVAAEGGAPCAQSSGTEKGITGVLKRELQAAFIWIRKALCRSVVQLHFVFAPAHQSRLWLGTAWSMMGRNEARCKWWEPKGFPPPSWEVRDVAARPRCLWTCS